MCLVAECRAVGFASDVSTWRALRVVNRSRLVAALALAGGMAVPRAATAQEVVGTAYRLRLEVDLPIVLIGGAVASSFFFMDEAPGVACAPECDRSRLNALDRPSAGNYDPNWSKVGNIATAATMLAPIAVLTIDRGFQRGLNDSLVVAEAALVASALQITVSYAAARPRPRVYGTEAPLGQRTDANAARSFFSGHVANTVATTVAGFRTYQRLHRPAIAWTLLGLGLAGSTFVGVSRVAAGSHFPTDVVAGAAVGAGMGLALPAMHSRGTTLLPLPTTDGAGLSLLTTF
jgi:membrane-associated phospholipid phosphatase